MSMTQLFWFNLPISIISLSLNLIIRYKINNRRNELFINKNEYNYYLEKFSSRGSLYNLTGYESLSFIFIFSFIPFLNVLAIIANFSVLIGNKLNKSIENLKYLIINDKLSKIKKYAYGLNENKFYSELESLMEDNSLYYNEFIIGLLNGLIVYIEEYENLKELSDSNVKFKKETLDKIRIGIGKFNDIILEINELNLNKSDSTEIDNFINFLDNVSIDIKNNKAIFVK